MQNEKILTATDLQIFLSSVVRGEVQDEQLMTRLIGKGCSVVERYEYRASVKDRLRAAELLGKIIGAFDKQEATDAGNIFISTLKNIWAHEDGDSRTYEDEKWRQQAKAQIWALKEKEDCRKCTGL